MARLRSNAKDFAVYLLVRLLVGILQSLSVDVGGAFARLLAWLAYAVDRRHRNVALDNLRHAFPDSTPESRQRMVRRVYHHFALVLIEMLHLPRKLRHHNWRDYIHLSPQAGDRIVGALLQDGPVLIVTGHFGNWEMAGYALAMFGFRSYAIARPLDNPYLDRFLRRFRERTGQQLLAKKGELDRIEEILRQGGIICTLGDQDAGRRGAFVDFFGRPASTHKAIAILAMKYRATILVAAARRTGKPMQYEIVVGDRIDADEYDAPEVTVHSLTQRFTTAWERIVRLDPSQYLWLHRRWKHQPSSRSRRRAA